MGIMRAHDRGAHLPEEWPKDIPSDARPILLQALARKPEQRYATVQAFLEALNAVQTAAVKQRIVEKAERLYDEMNEALENGAFADAVALGEELLSLQPDHARARQRLQEAKSRFERFNRLLNQIEAEQERLDAKERERKQRASRAHTRLTEVTSTQAELKNERENIQQRLTEVTGKLQEYNVEVTELQQQLQAAERQRKVHQQAKEHIKNILSTLQAGDLQTAQQKFSQVDFTRGDIAEPEVIVEVDTSDEHFTEDGAVIEGDNLSHKTNSVKKKEIWALAFAIFIMLLIMFVASAFR
jgi:chromosome segregation ATPase